MQEDVGKAILQAYLQQEAQLQQKEREVHPLQAGLAGGHDMHQRRLSQAAPAPAPSSTVTSTSEVATEQFTLVRTLCSGTPCNISLVMLMHAPS
jgi:hypothetical protein